MHDTLADTPGAVRPGPWWPELARLAAAGGLCALLLFLVWEGVERTLAGDDRVAHRIHYARGVSSSLLTACAVGLVGWQQHRRREAVLSALAVQRAQDAREARQLLEMVVDATPAALLVLDGDLRVVRANRLAEQVHGGPLVGSRCHDALLGRCDRCAECPGPGTFATALACPASGTHTDPRTGEVLAVETHPLRLPDGSDYVLLVERVVTEQKKLQARLLHQEKMAAFGLLAAGVAHEMGNPLASVEAQLQLLDEARLTADDAPVVATVRQEVGRLRRILREMVDFARRRRDEATLVCVQSVVSDALRFLRHDPRMRRVLTREEFDPETPPVLMVEDHLMQVVLNLLLNALDIVREALLASGYRVLEARHGAEGLRIAESHAGPIDLLVSDTVMPGLGGRELADRIKASRPAMRVLYMSGYTDDTVVRHGVLMAEVAFLQKPFTLEALARKVRAVLDA